MKWRWLWRLWGTKPLPRAERGKSVVQPDKSASAMETSEGKTPGVEALSQSTNPTLSDLKQGGCRELLRKLQKPHTQQDRLRAIEQALNDGVPLHEIEELLDWLDQN